MQPETSETENKKVITISKLLKYLASIEKKREKEKEKRVTEYKAECEENERKVKTRNIEKIEKEVDRIYAQKIYTRNRIVNLTNEIKTIPSDIQKLQITKYMLYRVDIIRAEKIVEKAIKSLGKIYQDIQQEIEDCIENFEELKEVNAIDYSEYDPKGDSLAKAKEKYKLEYTEEERNEFIKEQLEVADKLIHFNSLPVPHEILKNCDRDIQSKLPKFNNARLKRIKILTTLKSDYEKLLDPKEIISMVDDALENLDSVQDILTKREYKSVRRKLISRRKMIFRGTNDIRKLIETKEKKTGVLNFKIQEARYLRMETLRNIITDATTLINANSTTGQEERLEKLKSSYEREKQFASVIENLEGGAYEEQKEKLRTFEKQIEDIESRINIANNTVAEQTEKMKKARGELITLWKMEVNSTLSKRKEESPELPAPKVLEELKKKTEDIEETKDIENTEESINYTKKTMDRLKRVPGGKHACDV